MAFHFRNTENTIVDLLPDKILDFGMNRKSQSSSL
jgi:hypothetical protein